MLGRKGVIMENNEEVIENIKDGPGSAPDRPAPPQKAKFSIFAKILLVALICMAVPLLLTCYYSNNMNGTVIKDTAAENLRALSASEADALDQFITAQKGIVCAIANNGQIINICKETADATKVESSERDKMSEFLLEIADIEGGIYENIFFTVGPQTYANTLGNMEETLTNVEGEEFYEACLANGSFFGTDVSPGSGLPVYVIAYAITDPSSGEVLGVVNEAISLAAMSESIVNKEDGGSTSVTLLDQSGNVVASPDESLILNYNVADSDAGLWSEIQANSTGDTEFSNDISGGESQVMGYTVGENYICMVYTPATTFLSLVNRVSMRMIIISLIAIVIAGVIIAIVTRAVVRPLMRSTRVVNKLIQDIEAGGGNLNTQLDITTNDEVGELGGSINQFIVTLKNIMTMLKNESDKLNDVSKNVSDSISSSQLEVNNMSAAMQEMSASGEETSASLQVITENIDDVTDLVNSVYELALKHVDESESTMRKVSSMSETAIENLDRSDERTKQLVEELADSIELAKKVENINTLVDDIIGISQQTNLLSLNASIEAARAGEAGKGFAVVAEEISNLAAESAEAASHIQQVSDEVISAVDVLANNARTMSDTLLENNENGRTSMRSLTDAYTEDIGDMVGAMNEFAENSSQANSAMRAMRESIEAINIAVNEMANGVVNSTASATDIAQNLEDIGKEALTNLDIAGEISGEVGKYEI